MHANSAPVHLPGALRARAEHFFRADFSEVRLSFDAVPARLGAVAVARGDTIHLAPAAAFLPQPAFMELVGHELAHVVQQRRGRVAPRASIGGIAVDDDEGLEIEARDLGRRFAHQPGDRPPPAGAGPRSGHPPIAQRAVSVAGTAVTPHNGLSERGRLVLALIDGGMEWLAWAASHPSARYDFADETQLVSAVQSGIHASPLTLLPGIGLWVSPVKLMHLRASDLRTILRAERGDNGTVVEAQTLKVLAEHGILTQADLARVGAFLSELGVAGAPVVSALGLDAQIAIYDLILRSQGDAAQQADLQQEAATFAVAQARTPFEFIDFYKFYIVYVTKLGLTGSARVTQANAAVQVLQPLLFGALDGPQINAPAGPREVARVVNGWLGAGRQLGFARLSTGVAQIIEHSRFTTETGDAAKAMAHGYVREAQAFLALNEPSGVLLGQDGATCVYPVEGEGARAELELGPSGILTLRSFSAAPTPAPASKNDTTTTTDASTTDAGTDAEPGAAPATEGGE